MSRLSGFSISDHTKTSAIYYFGNFFLNVFRYFFHLILLRLLTPSEYGEFLSYLSLMYVLAVPTGTVSNIVTKFVAGFKGKGDLRSINSFFYFLIKKTSPATLVLGIFLIIFSPNLARIFKAHQIAFIVLGLSTFISLIQTITSSYLSALQRFKFQTLIGFVGAFVTIILAILLIKTGFGATGAVVAQLSSGLLISILALMNIQKFIYPRLINHKKIEFSLLNFTSVSFIFALGTLSLVSVDVLMVRVLFDTYTSGVYATLSILGRMILFGLTPFATYLLPVVTLRHSEGKNTHLIFIKLAGVMLLFALLGTSIFILAPNTVVRILASSAPLEVANYLGIFSMGMVVFAFNQFILSYFMATNRATANYLLLLFSVAQPLVIFLARHSFSHVVYSSFAIQLGLLISLVFYVLYPYLYAVKFSHEVVKKKQKT